MGCSSSRSADVGGRHIIVHAAPLHRDHEAKSANAVSPNPCLAAAESTLTSLTIVISFGPDEARYELASEVDALHDIVAERNAESGAWFFQGRITPLGVIAALAVLHPDLDINLGTEWCLHSAGGWRQQAMQAVTNCNDIHVGAADVELPSPEPVAAVISAGGWGSCAEQGWRLSLNGMEMHGVHKAATCRSVMPGDVLELALVPRAALSVVRFSTRPTRADIITAIQPNLASTRTESTSAGLLTPSPRKHSDIVVAQRPSPPTTPHSSQAGSIEPLSHALSDNHICQANPAMPVSTSVYSRSAADTRLKTWSTQTPTYAI